MPIAIRSPPGTGGVAEGRGGRSSPKRSLWLNLSTSPARYARRHLLFQEGSLQSRCGLPADAVCSDIGFERIQLLVEILDLFFEKTAHGNHRLYVPHFIDNRKMANMILNHNAKRFFACGSFLYRLNRRSHDFLNSCRLRVAS